jgi:hypothetical protein
MILARFDIPIDPDAPHARQWLFDELSKPEYQAAKPTWFDIVSKAISDWLGSLRLPQVNGPAGVLIIIAVVVVIGLIVTAIVVYGVPRVSRRNTVHGALFDGSDRRTAEQLRGDARAAAARGDWDAAVLDGFRGLSVGLAERTIVSLSPGSTAHEIAEQAARAFPACAPGLRQAASAFDRVRYLGGSATNTDYERLDALDTALRAARPEQSAFEPHAGVNA